MRTSVITMIKNLPRLFAKGLIQVYRYSISPLMAGRCRFYPTCSAYAQEALDSHGFLKGSKLIISRLLRCHPWHPGGFDPVPESSDRLNRTESDNHIHQPESVARKSWICKEHS